MAKRQKMGRSIVFWIHQSTNLARLSWNSAKLAEDMILGSQKRKLLCPMGWKRSKEKLPYPKHVIDAPAVAEPHQGTSYNPSVEVYQELLLKERSESSQPRVATGWRGWRECSTWDEVGLNNGWGRRWKGWRRHSASSEKSARTQDWVAASRGCKAPSGGMNLCA